MDITENMTTRPLKASDLDQVVDIDKRIVGWSRRGFFQNVSMQQSSGRTAMSLLVPSMGRL